MPVKIFYTVYMSHPKEPLIGAHTSAAGGVSHALLEGKEIGATTIQLFTSNQKQWASHPLTSDAIDEWNKALHQTQLRDIMSHDSYLINLGSPKEEVLTKSRIAFQEEIQRCLALNISYLNFHPGASLDGNTEVCLDRIIDSLLGCRHLLEKEKLRLTIETTAGQGTNVGYQFDQLAYILDKVDNKIPLGICIDTCHIFAAGYDIRTAEAWEKTLCEFDKIIGLDALMAFHLNDSVKGLGSKVDRHAPLGEGEIGWECFSFLMKDKRVSHLPKYLETPGGPSLWKEEISKLKDIYYAHKN